MRRLLQWLIAFQALVAIVGLVAAIVDVESILVSGSVATGCGFLIARLAFGADRFWGLLFGLGGPTIAVGIGCWIAIERWAPHDAQRPVAVVLGIVAPVYLVIGAFAFRERRANAADDVQPGRWRFTVGTLMMLTLLVAVPLGIYRTWGGGQVGAAAAVAATQAVIVGATCWRFRGRRPVIGPG